MPSATTLEILTDQPIPTWFGIGGRAKRFARPQTVEQLAECLRSDPNLRVLGEGANLLVADAGVQELVVSLAEGQFGQFTIGLADQRGYATVAAGAGVHLFKLINATVDAGLTGLENLAGIPASVGGAVMMNAGGKFGSTGDYVSVVHLMDRAGQAHTLKRNQIDFNYRHCALAARAGGAIITSVEFRLRRADAAAVRAKLKEATEYKKTTQPLSANSAGCCFKNPTLMRDVPGIGTTGTRVSAGMLIDKAGCKGLSRGGAKVSDQHANFVVAGPACTAHDVLEVMREARRCVQDKFGITIEPEVVIWGASL
ncbi:MAG: UDP-N-acetylmuramate dehydrogenase [Phycisphaerales bacterium]